MTFNFVFNINDKTFEINTEGIKLNITFDGTNLRLNTIGVTLPNQQSNVQSVDPLLIYRTPIGVTNYINSDELKQNKLMSDIENTLNITSDVYFNRTVLDLLTKLHRIDPRLNGVCMEGLLYQTLSKSLTINNDIKEQYNFNVIHSNNFLETHKSDQQFKNIIEHIYRNANFDEESKMPTRISYNNCSITDDSEMPITGEPTFGFNINESLLGLILYLVSYAYNNSEKRGFPTDNYSIEDIDKYGCCLCNNYESFQELCKYIEQISVKLRSLNPNIKFIADVPIDDVNTKQYRLTGNVDLLATTNNEQNYIFDIKCCKNDDNYSDYKWPAQLNLYREGLKNKYNINKLYIINIFTNHLISYNPINELNVSELI